MHTPRNTLLASALALAMFASTGCSEVQQAASEARQGIEQATAQAGNAAAAIEEARRKLHEGNLSLGGDGNLPKAELTPQGDLLINGLALPMTEAQREAALAYREKLLAVTDAGMAIGTQGAAIASQAVGQAVGGLLGGSVEAVTQQVEAGTQKIEASAQALCQQLEALKAAQSQFATVMPEFAPYAQVIDVQVNCPPASG